MKQKLLTSAIAVNLAAFAGQASAHVSYGQPLIDQQGDATSVMELGSANLTANSSQNLTATSNAGYQEDHNATYWGNSHDNKFLWFSTNAPETITFTLTGLDNTGYTYTPTGTTTHFANNPVTGQAYNIDTLLPAFNLFSGNVQYLSHDGAYQASNTGFAPWSSWAWESLPTSQGGAGGDNSAGNPVYGKTYTVPTDAVTTANGTAGQTIDGTLPGVTQHMGVFGSNNGLQIGDTVSMANNQSQTTYANGTPLTNHNATMTLVADGAYNADGTVSGSGDTVVSNGTDSITATITLPSAGVYSLVVSGNSTADYNQLMADAIEIGMGGSEGFQTNSLGLYIQAYSNDQYYDTATQQFTNVADATTVANDGTIAGSSGYTGSWGTPVIGFSVAATSGHTFSGTGPDTSAGSAYVNTWTAVEQYSAVDRAAHKFNITVNSVAPISAVPVPGAVWMFLSGMMGMFGFSKYKSRKAI